MSELADNVCESLRIATERAYEDVGAEIVADLRRSIGVRVVRARGPRGGTIIIRSKPGEPPRLDNGDFWKSIGIDVRVDGDVITLNVVSNDKKGEWLEKGTSRMLPRPSFQPTFDRWSERITSQLSDALSKNL